ncbi:MAG: hypothetical protein P4L36_06430 [Holophaga sp.]|nr:hypothetical protein [Holophaga sp.]
MSLLALQDLFRRYREKATGIWTLGKDPGRTIFIDYGDTVFAQSTHTQDRLTYILVEKGKVTQAQMDYALANLKPGLSIGKNLIEMGFITQRDLLDMAKSQVERIVRGALACADLEPSFKTQELDANVVRLPMNTPQLFLAGTLALQDREGLLELLGPLNQVVVLQGRNLMDLSLPVDLAKLPPLLDGTHTLLELSRESLAEPLRLGAFALFLREMGWARLHEMPPLDRHALDLALAPEPEPLSPPLAERFPETVPSLFSTIQEAALPTTNLEHLSRALDEEPPVPLPLPLPVPEPEPPAPQLYLPEALDEPGLPTEPENPGELGLEAGQGYPPTPAMPIHGLAEEPDEAPLALIPLDNQGPGLTISAEAPLPPLPPPAAPGKILRRTLLAILVLVCLGAAGYLGLHRAQVQAWLPARAGAKAPAPVPPPPPATPPAPVVHTGIAVPPPAPQPAPPAPAAPAKPEPVAQARPEPAPPVRPEPPARAAEVSTSISARIKALDQGDLELAVRQGKRLVKEVPPSHWTLRLEIACQGETIQRLVGIFHGHEPDIFLLPIAMRDGRVCYQVLYGRFPTQAAADKQLKRLPASFLADRNRPKKFRFAELPKVQ